MAPIHLLTLVHGMWGTPENVAEMNRVILDEYSSKESDSQLRVLVAEANKNEGTYDGIDWCGERVAEEITAYIATLEAQGDTIVKFSIAGYSLGGLISRYVIGILHQRGFFASVTPVNFNTVATPHIGLLRYPSLFNAVKRTLGPRLLSRTGEQFFCVDKWSTTGQPLIQVMADPDKIFFKALALFKKVRIYANAVNDQTVPFATAFITAEDPFIEHETNGIDIEYDPDYPRIVKSWRVPPPNTLTQQDKKELLAKRKARPRLPPFLQFRFPLNLVFYTSLPLLLPLILSMVITRFALAAKGSKARIRELEKAALLALESSEETETESKRRALLHLVEKWERDLEGVVVQGLEEAGDCTSPMDSSSTLKSSPSSPSASELSTVSTKSGCSRKERTAGPILLPVQHTIIANLNSLPQLEKFAAWFPEAFNSHAVIVSRDPQRFEFHKEGEIILRHWARAWEL